MQTKACKSCGIEKPINEFDFEPRVSDKLTARCHLCLYAANKAWAEAHPEKIAAARQKYRETHAERDRENRRRNQLIQSERRREKAASDRANRGLQPTIPAKYRTNEDGRLCTACRRRKTLLEFGSDASTSDGLDVYCKDCKARSTRESQKKWTAERREQQRRYNRRFDVRRLYNVSFDKLAALLDAQSNRCAICRDEIDLLAPRRNGNAATVDHDHSTGEIRGLLCLKCNAGLGQYRDSEWYLLAAIAYLREHRRKSAAAA